MGEPRLLQPAHAESLDHAQVETMVEQVTGGKAYRRRSCSRLWPRPTGCRLFVEELTKIVGVVGSRRAVQLVAPTAGDSHHAAGLVDGAA